MNRETLRTSELDATLVLTDNQKSAMEIMTKLEQEQINAPEFAERFDFICKFAAGGVGVLSKAKDTVFDRVVAVKSLNDQLKDRPEIINSFIHESRLNAQLDHPSIVPVYALGRGKDGHWQCVMKFINGSSLYTFIDKIRNKYDSKKVSQLQEHHALLSRLEYFLKICEVVEYCHSMKIVHGDIKPDNILMGKFGEVYLMDWGCAREFGSTPEHLSGTPNYLPPEFLKERVVTPQIDVFALGMLLFEMTTLRRGKQLCTGKQSGDCTCRVVFDIKNYVHYVPKLKINDRLKAVIMKAVNPDPAQRYKTVKELSMDVRHFVYDEEVSAAPDNLLQKFFRKIYRNRIKTILTAAFIFILFCGTLSYSYYRSTLAEAEHAVNMMRRLKMTSYTEMLASAVETRFLRTQAQLLLFVDNLIEDTLEKMPQKSKFYGLEEYKDPAKSPPGMIRTGYYPFPINLSHMLRVEPEGKAKGALKLQEPGQYVYICSKILTYDLCSHAINEIGEMHKELLTPENMINRLFVKWADDTRDCYPGTYMDPSTPTYENFWKTPNFGNDRKNYWSSPYFGVLGLLRIASKYPMFSDKDQFLGVAGIELRLDKLLAPLINANKVDPVHELYLITKQGDVLFVADGKVHLLTESTVPSSGKGLSVVKVKQLLQKLQKNNMQQVDEIVKGEPYYVSGAYMPIMEGFLLQMISVEAMKHHNHKIAL